MEGILKLLVTLFHSQEKQTWKKTGEKTMDANVSNDVTFENMYPMPNVDNFSISRIFFMIWEENISAQMERLFPPTLANFAHVKRCWPNFVQLRENFSKDAKIFAWTRRMQLWQPCWNVFAKSPPNFVCSNRKINEKYIFLNDNF